MRTARAHRDQAIDGKKVKWVHNPNDGNAYQTKLDEALKAQKDAMIRSICSLLRLTTL